ncbi:MAG: formate dehydrogenase accessory protein FdhE [Chloroflexi bacterium]|nr:formate dehydrogenase accessory protein FdhE [Chloroflexota bacterium]
MSTSRDERHAALQARLQSARRQAPDLIPAIDYYGALVAALIDEEPHVDPPPLDSDGVARKFAAGEPILPGESLGLDEDAIRALLVKLCLATESFGKVPSDLNPRRLSWFQGYRADRDPSYARGVDAARIRHAVEEQSLDWGELMGRLTTGEDADLAELADRNRLDAALLATLARLAMRPTMAAFATAFEPLVRAHEAAWGRDTCPMCGSAPALGEHRDGAAFRRMRCATCGAAWPLQVDRCVDVKSVNAEEPLADEVVLLEELLTLARDAGVGGEGQAKT